MDFGDILVNTSILFNESWKWTTHKAPRKTSMGRFIHLMNFYLSLDIQMYPKYPHFGHSGASNIAIDILFVLSSSFFHSQGFFLFSIGYYLSSFHPFIKRNQLRLISVCALIHSDTQILLF